MSRQRAISNTWHRSIDNIVIWFYVNGKLILLLNAFALTNFTCYNTRLIDRAKSGCTPYHLCTIDWINVLVSFLYCPFLNLIVDSIKRQVEMKWIKKTDVLQKRQKNVIRQTLISSLLKENRPNVVRCAVLYRTSLNFDTISSVNLRSNLWFCGSIETWNIDQNKKKRLLTLTKQPAPLLAPAPSPNREQRASKKESNDEHEPNDSRWRHTRISYDKHK